MSTLYEDTRDAIETILNGVVGVGKVYKSPRHVTDWETFVKMHSTQERVVNVGWYSMASASDSITGTLAAVDDTDFIHYTERTEAWEIEYFYGFKDSDTEPSDFDFQLLVERIEDAFRFAQDLGDVAYQNLPLQRTFSGLWMLGNVVLCHRAAFRLTVIHRIQNPAI